MKDYLTKALEGLIQEMVYCDIEKYIADMYINAAHTVFIFKKGTPKNLIKIIQVLYKGKLTTFESDGIFQIVF